VRIGLALPQYDYSVSGESPLRFETILDYAREAERLGFDSLWLSDHLFLDLAKYGGTTERVGAFDPLVTLAALSRSVTGPRLGTLVCCEALRPASVLAKALATLDQLCDGRLDIGIGTGWYAPEYEAIGLPLPSPGDRLQRLRDAIEVCRGLLGGGPFTFTGPTTSVFDAPNQPPARQQPRPPIIVGGKGDRLLQVVADLADGWNTSWEWTVPAYVERLGVLERACERAGRDPATVTRSLGLYTLAGEDSRDLSARFDRIREARPPGVQGDVTLDSWRRGHLVGTVDEVGEQAAAWAELGIETLIVGMGLVPFSATGLDDLELMAAALGIGP